MAIKNGLGDILVGYSLVTAAIPGLTMTVQTRTVAMLMRRERGVRT